MSNGNLLGTVIGLGLTVGVVSALAPKVRRVMNKKRKRISSLERELMRI